MSLEHLLATTRIPPGRNMLHREDFRLAPALLSLLFVDISLQRSSKVKNVNISYQQVSQ
jgi:hypothetical protein